MDESWRVRGDPVWSMEYIWLCCTDCDDRVKIAQNKGNHWKEYPGFINEFLIKHIQCPSGRLEVRCGM